MAGGTLPSRSSPDAASKAWLLVSPLYVAALGALLLNDFVLKRACPCFLTGKLSDFAGLFALGVFLLVFTRAPAALFALAACFAVWKLPPSDALIRAWNAATGLTVGRTVDPTDLIALGVLPLAWRFYRTSATRHTVQRGWGVLSLLASLFAFTATTRRMPEEWTAYHAAIADFKFTGDQTGYRLSLTRPQLYAALEARGFTVSAGTELAPRFGEHDAYIFPTGNHSLQASSGVPELQSASFVVENTQGGVTLRLTNLSIKKAGRAVTRTEALRLFEVSTIELLQ